MTAILFCAYKDHVIAYSDGASYDSSTGIYMAPKQKIDLFPHLGALVATRGSGVIAEILKSRLSYYKSFSDMKIMLPTELLGAATDGYRMGDEVNLEVIIAGIPDYEGKAEIYRTGIAGHTPWDRIEGSLTMEEIEGGFYVSPGLSEEEARAAGLYVDEENPWQGTTDSYYIAYFEAMRAIPRRMDWAGKLVGCNVGGFIQKHLLAPGLAVTETIHRWPDVIGQPLNGFQPYVEEEEAA